MYFESKEQVFEALVREIGNALREEIAPFFEDRSAPTAQSIRADLMRIYSVFANDRHGRELLRLLVSEGVRFPELVDDHFQNFVRPLLERLSQRLRQGIETGAFRATPVVNFPELLLGPALSFHIWKLLFLDRKPLDAEQHFAAALDLILMGILPPENETSEMGAGSKPPNS